MSQFQNSGLLVAIVNGGVKYAVNLMHYEWTVWKIDGRFFIEVES